MDETDIEVGDVLVPISHEAYWNIGGRRKVTRLTSTEIQFGTRTASYALDNFKFDHFKLIKQVRKFVVRTIILNNPRHSFICYTLQITTPKGVVYEYDKALEKVTAKSERQICQTILDRGEKLPDEDFWTKLPDKSKL